MFGRRTDDPGGGNRGGNGGGDEPRERRRQAPEHREAEPTDDDVFAEGIRIETSRRRPRAAGEADDADDADPTAVTRYSEPLPAVPPSAGGAHRAAVYRQAPPAAAPEPSAAPSTDTEATQATETETAAPAATTAAATGPEQGEQAMNGGDDSKRLTVGQGIRLKGEISNCDALIVEGNVEADLSQCRSISVGETGVFSGTVRVEEATIAGQFQGKLVVSGVLSIKKTGRVRGEVRYGALQVDAGGVLAGSADTNEAGADNEGAETGDGAARHGFGTRQTAADGGD